MIADDYSDPFDAKSELNKMVKGENTGYMEPYEAQRIMTGKKIKLHMIFNCIAVHVDINCCETELVYTFVQISFAFIRFLQQFLLSSL